MRKAIAILLSLLMVLSLAACGSQTTTEEGGTTNEQTEATTPEVEETEQNEESTEIVEATAPETEPAFDNSWTNNDYEKQIPEIPFDNWSVGEAHDENAHRIKVKDVLYTDAKEYGELLTDCAFTQNLWVADETEGLEYRLAADNESGFSISYDFNAYSDDEPITGLLVINIYDNRIENENINGVSWGDEEIDTSFPALPEGVWEGNVYDDEWSKTSVKSCNTLTKEELEAYVEILKEAGFTDDMDEDPQDYVCRFNGSKTNNKLHITIQMDDIGDGVMLTEAFATINKQ